VRESAIAETAHGIEDFVSSASDTIGPSFGSRLLGLVETIAQALPANVQAPEPAPSVAGAAAAAGASVRIGRRVRGHIPAGPACAGSARRLAG
jgi:hypothetical protein